MSTINDYVEEINDVENSASGAFTSALPNFLCVTLKAPQKSTWVNKTSFEQKKCYSKWFNTILNRLCPFAVNKHSKLIFEYYKSGHVHAHGYIYMEGNYCVQGMIADLAKLWLSLHRLSFRSERYYDKYDRYTDDSICIQYLADLERQNKWIYYMGKDQGKYLN